MDLGWSSSKSMGLWGMYSNHWAVQSGAQEKYAALKVSGCSWESKCRKFENEPSLKWWFMAMALDLPTVVLHGHLPLLKVPSWPGPNRDQRSHEGPHPVAHLPSGQVRWDSAKWRPHCRWLHKSPPIRSWCIGRCPTPIRKFFLLFLNPLTLNFLPVWSNFNEFFGPFGMSASRPPSAAQQILPATEVGRGASMLGGSRQ